MGVVLAAGAASRGSGWSAPRLVVSAPNHQLVSPAVVQVAPGDWRMWSVNSGVDGCTASTTKIELRRSADGITWSAPQATSLATEGGFAWHVDVQWIAERREYWAMFNVKDAESCTTEELRLATSPDGVHWTSYPSLILRRGAIPELADIVYRATFVWDGAHDAVTIWHSGASFGRGGYAWRAARERRSRAELFAAVSAQGKFAGARAVMPRRGPPLNNRSAP